MHDVNLQFDACAQSLESKGYALLPLSDELSSSISNAFKCARDALNYLDSSKVNIEANSTVPVIDSNSDSGSWTGYHRASSQNGRYNKNREGFVFSNGGMFEVPNKTGTFVTHMDQLFDILHNVIANGVLVAIEKRLQLPLQYFRSELGPTDTSSQWHIKRYDIREESDSIEAGSEVLPMHTDPSLISVVILDCPQIQSGCMGLEVYNQSDRTWKEIEQHGHGVAIIFVGSVLSHLIKDKTMFQAAKHRVVKWWHNTKDNQQRVVATLFVRPQGNAIMKPLPSPMLSSSQSKKSYQTFSHWNTRVARNYMKKKKKEIDR